MKALVLSAKRRGVPELVDPSKVPASTIWADPVLGEAEIPVPDIVGPHDVIVRVAFCGICGSDLHCSEAGPDGYVSFGGPARLPVVLGHEFTGTVVHAGEAVAGVAVGDLVAAESVQSCWDCDDCREGHLNECGDVELLGLTIDGALAPLVRVDARHCHSLAPIVRRFGGPRALELGALLEPLGVACRGLMRAGMTSDERMVVVGTGPIGLGTIMLAKAAGVAEVLAFDLIRSRVELAEAAGACAFNAMSPGEPGVDIAAATHRAFGSRAASLAVEAAGTPEAFESAFASLGNRGRLLVLGRMPSPVPFDTNALLSKALTVIGSRGHAGHDIFQALIDRIADGSLDPSPLITAVFDASSLTEAFAHARRSSGAKTLVRMEASA